MNLKELKNKYDLQDLEVSSEENSDYQVSFSANKLKQTEIDHNAGLSVRLVKNGKIGLSTAYGKVNIEDLINDAVETSKFYPESNLTLISTENKKDVNESGFSGDFLDLSKTKGTEIINYVKDKTKSDNLLIDLSFSFGKSIEKVFNSSGLSYEYLSTGQSFFLTFRETANNDFLEIYTGFSDLNLDSIYTYVDELIDFYKYSRKQAKPKNGTYPVLFTSRAAKELLGIIDSALDGKQVIDKATPWQDKLGEKVLSEKISISQDPSFGYMKRTLDDEGIPIQKLDLIKNGTLNSFYFDLLTAGKSNGKYKSTGNGFKPSLGSQHMPSLLNFITSKGNKSRDEIIKNLDYGIIIDQTMGGLTANISGDISFNLDLGFLVEKGEVVGRVKDTMVSGNVYNALNKVVELSDSPRFYWGSTYNPDMLLDGFTVTI